MDSLQASLEAEARAKAEALRIKKKLESDINELEIALDHANKANTEAHKSIKRYQAQLRDVEGLYEEESRQRREISEKAGLADRRANALQAELEESRAFLDSADRGKKLFLLSRDHRPNEDYEVQRIVKNGGGIYQT